MSAGSPDSAAEANARVRRHRLPRLGGAARPAHGRGRRCARRSATTFPSSERPRGRRPHGHRRARARQRRERRRRAAARQLERAAEALNAALPDDVAVVAAEEAAPDFHARFSARSRSYRYRIWRSRDALAVRGATAAGGIRGRSTSQRLHAQAALAARRARLPRVHADRDAAQGVRAHRRVRRAGSTTATCSCSRSRPTRSCGTWCGRSSARWSTASTSRRCSRGGRASEAGQTAPPSRPLPRRALPTIEPRALSRSSSSTSTARSSTPPRRSSSARSTTRPRRCCSRRFPDEQILAQVGGSNLAHQMALLDPDHVDELVARLPRAQRSAVLRARVLRRRRRRARAAEGRRPAARRRHREAAADRRARLRGRGHRRLLRRRRRLRRHGAAQAAIPSRC